MMTQMHPTRSFLPCSLGVSALAVSAVLISGCAVERDYNSSMTPDSAVQTYANQDYGIYGDIPVADARLIGDIGPMRNLDQDANVSGWDDGDYSTLEVVAENQNGAAMNLVDIYGGIDHPALRPGTTTTFSGDTYNQDGMLQVYVMGCAGAQAYQWDYDVPADEVEVSVSETGNGNRQFDYTATTYNSEFGTSTVSTGTFIVAASNTATP